MGMPAHLRKMTLDATVSQESNTPIHFKLCSASMQVCGTFHCTEGLGVQGAMHSRGLEGCDSENVLSNQRNALFLTDGGTRIFQVPVTLNAIPS